MSPESLTSASFWSDTAPAVMADHGAMAPGPSGIPELHSHVLFQTSGSSGTPKWIALSKAALCASADAVNGHLEVSSDSCWGLALPVHHVGGFGVAARAYRAGCRFVSFGRRWDPEAFALWMGMENVTHSSLVPAQVHDLVASGLRAPQGVRAVVVGGGRLEPAIGGAARELGWPVLASYGMTEAASQVATQRLDALKQRYQPGPLPLLPIWETGLAAGGRLRIAGPALFSGTVERRDGGWDFIPRLERWHCTQDLAEIDGGWLTPVGRADTLVKVLGELVDPESITAEVLELAQGAVAPGSFTVVAVADERAEHALVPVCDACADHDAVVAALSAYQKSAPGLKRLRPVVILADFPRSALGKPLRTAILDRLRQADR